MANDQPYGDRPGTAVPVTRTRLLGSLRDALAAAGRENTVPSAAIALPALIEASEGNMSSSSKEPIVARPSGQSPSAAEAAREARGAVYERREDAHIEIDAPTTRVVRGTVAKAPADEETAARTRLIRGRQSVKRTEFFQDPVVGWLVVIGGPGLGACRPIFEGNNTVGRDKKQRIPIDFGDDAISSEEQAFIRYDSVDRKFLLVPNLAKTNIVAVNERKPTGAVELAAMDLITMGRTQLVFVPFCGPEFDWAELTELKG
jgi:hypothetical protein